MNASDTMQSTADVRDGTQGLVNNNVWQKEKVEQKEKDPVVVVRSMPIDDCRCGWMMDDDDKCDDSDDCDDCSLRWR